uniref:NADH dehydrogenase subunit 6 n=1 Tax=Teredorus guangxiensis TaxID=510007 RepID=UPI0028D3DD17|nr:NADH dehydrogenase subunit 6 [Teredorus guangxiensis]WMV02073.1 NADH dehydrogenase subunit 6 [Teredorus guangxiensis]
MKLMIMVSALMNSLFMSTKQPMNMIIIIIMQTTMMTFMMNKMTKSAWMLYLLMIIFIGGMMVLFIYITSIAPNEKNKMNPKLIMSTMMITIMTINMIMYSKENMMNNETTISSLMDLKMNHQKMLNIMFNQTMYLLSITMMSYLFIALMAVNKITNIEMGPLRKKN